MRYFSERELGERPREADDICNGVWRGILVVIKRLVRDGSFGANFPDTCPDDSVLVIGTDTNMLDDVLRAEIPELAAQTEAEFYGRKRVIDALSMMDPPATFYILDLIEFCWKNIGAPVATASHSFFGHAHLILGNDQLN